MSDPRTFSSLPEDVALFLSDMEGFAFAKKIVETYGLEKSAVSEILGLIESIALGEIELATLPAELEELGIKKEETIKVASQIAVERLMPIAGVIGDVSGQIVQWGGSLKGLEGKQSAVLPQVTAEEFAKQAVIESGVSFQDSVMAHRADLIILSFLNESRDQSETHQTLIRSKKIGGLELSEDQAERLLAYISEKKGFLQIVIPKKPFYSKPEPLKPEPLKPEPPKISPPSLKKEKDLGVYSQEDEKEIEHLVTEKKELFQTQKTSEHSHSQIAQEIQKQAGLVLTPDQSTRFERLVDSRLRHVRSARQTYQQLEDALEQGGIALSGEKLSHTMELIEKAFDQEEAHHHTTQKEQKQVFQGKKQEKQEEKFVQAVKEDQLLAKRYVEITGKPPQQKMAPLAPVGARHTGAISAKEHFRRQEERIDTQKVRQVIEASKPVLSKKEVSHSSPTISEKTSGRPSVQDVRFSQRLAGPLEELQRLTVEDFRRLGATPQQALSKIQDKIDLLAEQGEEQRIAAIQAWRNAPLHQAYVAIAKGAVLSGANIFTYADEQQGQNREVLKKEELQAIMQLNELFRY